MNNTTRKQIKDLIASLEACQSAVNDAEYEDMDYLERLEQLVSIEDHLDAGQSLISELQGDEQDKFDNMPEGLQGSEKGEAVQAAADNLSEAESSISSAMYEINGVNELLKQFAADQKEAMTLDEVTDKAQEISDEIQNVIDYLEEAAQ